MSIAMVLAACSSQTHDAPTTDDAELEAAAEGDVPVQCKNVHLDHLDTDWTSVNGTTANPKIRLRVMKTDAGYEALFVDGSFTRRELAGKKRERDVKLVEVPSAAKVASGDTSLVTISLRPRPQSCSVRGNIGREDNGVDVVSSVATDFVPFPQVDGVVFSYDPEDEPLFLGEAAKSRKARDKQVAAGGPRNDTEMGTVPVGTWSSVEADGDPSCTYDMDLYFDDLLVDELSPMPAGEVADGHRHWFHAWEAPYTGNHHFEMFRFRTCAGGSRELIAVAGLDAILT
jgi:hypothetical protein